MAKRRTKRTIEVEKIIKRELLLLGDRILEKAVPDSRRRPDNEGGGRLQDEMNFRVLKDTQLNMFQMVYGKWNYPRNVNKKRQYINGQIVIDDEMNVLLNEVKRQQPEATKIIVGEINKYINDDFINKR